MNQIRMGISAGRASDREVDIASSGPEIASIAMGAFGWRFLAREAVAKIPFGGGSIPKVAIVGLNVSGRGYRSSGCID